MSAVAESLAAFRGTGDLAPELLIRFALPLGLASLELNDSAALVDLDEPTVLEGESLRPSVVATGRRRVTQSYALDMFERRRETAGLRWWSTLEAGWINLTLFDRGLGDVTLTDVRELTVDDDVVIEAATFLGLL